MDEEKKILRNQTATIYHFSCLKQGLRRLWSNPIKLAVSVVLWVMVCSALYIVAKQDFAPVQNLLLPLWLFVFLSIALLIIYLNGYTCGSYRIYNNLVRAGFVNFAGEAPLLIESKTKNKNTSVLTFTGVGFPRTLWEDHQQELEGVVKGYIGQIREIDRRSIEIVVVSSENAFQKILWDDSNIDWNNDARIILGKGLVEDIWVDIDKSPMMLIGGSTGSGKSVLLKTVLWQHIKRNNAVIIADFKGGVDFSDGWHQLTEIITGEEHLLTKLEEIVNELESRKRMFVAHKVKNIGEYRKNISSEMQRIIFACDEIAELMDKTGASKERKALLDEIELHISTIARQGRAFGIHLVLATQRPDANILSGQIKNNLDCRVCGKADATLSTIVVGDGKAHEAIPKDSQGRFIDQNGTVFQGFYFDY